MFAALVSLRVWDVGARPMTAGKMLRDESGERV